MKIACKCGRIITETLRPLKKMGVRPYRYINLIDENSNEKECFNPKGTFELKRKEKYNWNSEDSGIVGYFRVIRRPEFLIVPMESILDGIIPIMPDGFGCCNWSMGQHLKCFCGNILGEMYLDCYEMKNIHFFSKNVVRSYKTTKNT